MQITVDREPAAYTTSFRYTDRETKAEYVARKYASILKGSVLDVGCDNRRLRGFLDPAVRYLGVDLNPDADLVLNLDRDNLPLADRSFEVVVCTDVLEHLERCHAVFDELCRVAAARVLVSLPNPARNFVTSLADGSAGHIKYYGLPVDPPADRHRWFFTRDQAESFLTIRGRRAGFTVEQMDAEDDATRPPKCPKWPDKSESADLLDIHGLHGGTLWCLLQRKE